jgi:VCBS repeat-containing protein
MLVRALPVHRKPGGIDVSWDEILKGGSGSDTINGGSGDDYLQGKAGGDILNGDDGNDQIHGDSGDDHLRGGRGNDYIHGGIGTDTAYYSGSVFEYSYSTDGTTWYINHTGGSQIDGNDRVTHVERLVFADATIDLTQNNAPIAFADTASTDEDVGTYSSGSARVTDNDFDWEGSNLSVTPGTFTGAYGTLVLNANGSYTYTPHASAQALAAGQNVQDVFTYTVSDGSLSSTGTLTINLAGRNDAPVANSDTASGHENQVLAVNVLANDSDVDNGAVLTVVSASTPSGKGTASVVGNQVQFNPGTDFDHLAAGASEIVVVGYTIQDEHGATSNSTISITVTGTNDGPVANPDVAAGHENQVLTIDALANDTDVDDGAVKSLVSVSGPAGKGSAAIVSNQIVFDPGSDFDHLAQGASETVVLSYTMQDEHGATSSSTVTVTVTGTNDAPIANTDNAATGENSAVTVNVLANDTDADDGASLTVTAASAPAGHGSASVVANQIVFDPGSDFDYLAAGESASVAVSYTITDEHGATSSSTVNVTVNGANDAPTIDSGGTTASGAVTELPNEDPGENSVVHQADGVIAFDDLDLSDTHSASASAQGAGYLGTFTLDPVNQGGDSVAWHFDVSDADLDGLDDGEVVTQTYTITIDDGNGGTATQNVTITLTGASDAAGPPWYIDNSAVGSNNSGSQSNPFTSIAAFNAAQGTANGPAPGDTVYLLAGTGTYAEADGINLLDGQILIGVPAGALRPTIAPTAGDGVNIGSGNSISGIDLSSGSGDGIADSGGNVASLTLSDVNITTTSGTGVEIDDGGSGISITDVTIASGSGYAIYGVGIAGFSLSDSTVGSGAGSSGSISLSELTGTASFLGNALTGGGGHNLGIVTSAGSLNVTIGDSASNQATVGGAGGDGVHVETVGTASLTLVVDGVDFTGAGDDLLNVVVGGSSSQDITVTDSNFNNGDPGSLSGGLLLEGGGAGSNITVDYRIEDSVFTGATNSAIAAAYTPEAGMIRGSINGNTIGVDDGVATDAGSAFGYGIYVSVEKVGGAGAPVHTVTIEDNSVQDIGFGAGIVLRSSGGGSGNAATLEGNVLNNSVDELGDFALAGLYAAVGGSALSGDYSQLGLKLNGNTIDASDGDYALSAVYLEQTSSDAHFYFPGYSGSPDGEAYGGTASTDLAAFFLTQGNVLVDAPFGAFGLGVDAMMVQGATGDSFTYPDWP